MVSQPIVSLTVLDLRKGEGADVIAEDFRSGFPALKGKVESNLLLEGNVADKDRAVESNRLRSRKVST